MRLMLAALNVTVAWVNYLLWKQTNDPRCAVVTVVCLVIALVLIATNARKD